MRGVLIIGYGLLGVKRRLSIRGPLRPATWLFEKLHSPLTYL
jgi:hypothetical protein